VYNELLQRAKWGTLSQGELAQVAAALHEPDPQVDRYTLLHILGRAGDRSYRSLVERFLHDQDDPMIARLALQILCSFWGETGRYLEEVLQFIQWVPWDDEEYIRLVAISAAGEYLRVHTEPRVLRALIRIFENEEEDHLTRQGAYRALARAVRRDWDQLPAATRLLDLTTQSDPLILQLAKERLLP